MWGAVDGCVDALRDEMYELLTRLVRIKSTLFHEAPAQQVMAECFARLGCDVDVFEPQPDALRALPGYSPVDWSYDGRCNVAGRIRGMGRGRSLVLNGHIDIVDEAPASHWTVDPYAAVARDGKMYGRGAGDMKSGLVAMVWAIAALRKAGLRPGGDLVLESVIEEECTGNGTLAACARGYLADAAIVCEPSGLRGTRSAMGVQWARVRTEGHASHAGRAADGVNAIEKAYVVVRAVQALEAQRNADRHPLYADTPRAVFCNVGTIAGGTWPSSVPAECEVQVRLGVFPGRPLAAARREFEAMLARIIREQDDRWLVEHPPVVEWIGFQADGCVFDTTTEFARTLAAAHARVVGRPLEHRVQSSTNDMRFFNLYYGMPSTTYGPACAGAHAADEYVVLDSIPQAAKVYTRFIEAWCGLDA